MHSLIYFLCMTDIFVSFTDEEMKNLKGLCDLNIVT